MTHAAVPVGARLWRLCAVLLLLGATACTPASPEQIRWRLELTSSGGISGQGLGRVVATSDGAVASSRFGRTCEMSLVPEDLRAIQQAVASVAPGNWRTDYLPPETQVCCDRISWRLDVTLEMSDGTKRSAYADWHEAAADQLPADLRSLANVAQRLLTRSIESCRES